VTRRESFNVNQAKYNEGRNYGLEQIGQVAEHLRKSLHRAHHFDADVSEGMLAVHGLTIVRRGEPARFELVDMATGKTLWSEGMSFAEYMGAVTMQRFKLAMTMCGAEIEAEWSAQLGVEMEALASPPEVN
jgi:hypothetical protein